MGIASGKRVTAREAAAILGVPLALPLGVLVFLGSFIPIVGALVTGAVAVLLALVANGWVNALIMLGVVLLVQQLESHILQPLVEAAERGDIGPEDGGAGERCADGAAEVSRSHGRRA